MRACREVDPDRVVFRPLGRVVVQGRSGAVGIHELVALREDVTDRTRECLARFALGLAAYEAQDWERALREFEASAPLEPLQPDPASGVSTNPSLVFARLTREFRANPPAPGWDGAHVMTRK